MNLTLQINTDFHIWEIGQDNQAHAYLKKHSGDVSEQSSCKGHNRAESGLKTTAICTECFRRIGHYYRAEKVVTC